MRLIFLPAVACAAIATTTYATEQPDAGSASAAIPAEYRPCTGSVPVFNPEGCESVADLRERLNCRDTIERVRESNGQPALRRENAEPDRLPMIAAVDHRIDGCSVMVMRNDTGDIRPLPQSDGEARLRPAGSR